MSRWTCGSCDAENVPGTRFCGYCGAAAAAPAPEERRLVTALFADLSGFTSLAERLDAEQLLEVIDPIIAGLSSIVGRYEGHVEKYAGDALLALFGAPVAHDDDPDRALRAALDMHDELDRICARLPPHGRSLSLHVGVASGHAIARMLGGRARTDYGVLGDAVILAQRLEAAAPAGETYVGETTVQLTRRRFEFEPVGELTLKGKSALVPAWRLLGPRSQPAPGVGGLVGRAREVGLVEEVVDRGGVLAVVGEPGIGKSRLTAEVRARAEARGIRWLQGRCLSYGASVAYWPYSELLREAADRPVSPYIDRLLGLRADIEVEPEAYRRGLHGDVESWLRTLAAAHPTVLALEDVHWADEPSLALTSELAAICGDSRLTLYLVSRREGADVLHEVANAARTLELGPLDRDEVEAILVGLLGELPPGLADRVYERTAGNPFFVGELARALQERGATPDELPPTVEGVLAARLDLLPRAAATLLQTASVIGRRVPLPLLERVAGVTEGFDAALDQLVAGGFLERGIDQERLTFRHALMQDAAYGRLLARARRDLHRRVADAAERLYGAGDDVVELLARHLYLAEAGRKAVEYLVRAAKRARALYANDAAILHLERALELGGDDPEIALALADVRELVGDYEEALRLYLHVRDTSGDPRAWRGAAATLRKQGCYDDALALLDCAPDDLALRLERGWTLSVAGRFDQAVAVLEAALGDAEGREDGVVGHLLLQLARAETVSGRLGPALAHVLDAERIFDHQEDLRGLATALRIEGNVYAAVGRVDEAAAALRRGLGIAERVGDVEELGGCLVGLGLVELELGNIREAIELDRRAIEEFERIGHGSGRAAAYGNLAEKLLAGGELEQALHHGERALAIAADIGHTPTVADVQRTIARILLHEGRSQEAARRAEEAAALFHEMGAEEDASSAIALAEEARR
jgi:class 3 adenylate cyclase/tetratricopeptide (TPR) repeat protein